MSSTQGRHEDRRLLWTTLVGVAVAFFAAALWSEHSRTLSASLSRVTSGLGDREGEDFAASADSVRPDSAPETDGNGARRYRELPSAGRRVAPLPKSGRNAPLIYVDGPRRKAPDARASD